MEENCCPLCDDYNIDFYHEDLKRSYFQCPTCSLVYVPPSFQLSSEEEKAEYDLHENDPHDQGYRRFLSRMTVPLLSKIKPTDVGLDFGCGPGPTLSVMMKDLGFHMDIYDPHYFHDSSVFTRTYDFITATEVAEHLSLPGFELSRLFAMLNPGGTLGLMTKMVLNKDAFFKWHYIQDPTHISFFSRATFEYLAVQFGAKLSFEDRDVIFLKKITVPQSL